MPAFMTLLRETATNLAHFRTPGLPTARADAVRRVRLGAPPRTLLPARRSPAKISRHPNNGGARGEVAVKAISGGAPLGSGPGGSAIVDIEIRYSLGRDTPGVYTYSTFTHKADYPATSIGEARFCAKLSPKVFDFMTIVAN